MRRACDNFAVLADSDTAVRSTGMPTDRCDVICLEAASTGSSGVETGIPSVVRCTGVLSGARRSVAVGGRCAFGSDVGSLDKVPFGVGPADKERTIVVVESAFLHVV